MTTGTIIVQDALFQRGVLAEGQAPNADQLATGLRFLNRMLDSWSAEKAMIFVITQETFTTVDGTGEYDTDDFDSGNGRPSAVNFLTLTLSGVTYNVTLVDNQTYAQITFKNINSIPTICYYDSDYPVANFFFYPVPYAAFTAAVDVYRPITSAITASTNLVLPEGYEKAIVDNLTIYYNSGVPPTAQMRLDAKDSRDIIKRANYTPLIMNSPINSGYSVSNDFPMSGW